MSQGMGSGFFMQSGGFASLSYYPLHPALRVGDYLTVSTIAVEEPMGRMVVVDVSLESSGQVLAQRHVAILAAWAAPALPCRT